MRKLFVWLIPLIVVCILSVGIVIGITAAKNAKQSNVFATKLSYNYSKLTIAKDNEITLTKNEISVEPQNCTQKLFFNTDNENVLSVEPLSGKIKGIKIGTCNLIVSINKSEVEKITIKIPVEVIQSSNPNKTRYDRELQLNFSDGVDYMLIEYQTSFAEEDCNSLVVSGNEIVESCDFEYKKIYLTVTGVGVIEIYVSTPNEDYYFTVNVI